MGSLVNRGDMVRAIVRLKGTKAKAKTFPRTKEGVALARRWIIEQEAEIIKTARFTSGHTIAQVLDRAREHELKKPYPTATAQFMAAMSADLGPVDLSKLTAEWWVQKVAAWDIRPSSRATYLNRISGALRQAQSAGAGVRWDEFKRAQEILYQKKITGKAKSRTRRLSDEEIDAIKGQVGISTASPIPLADIIDLALATALRIGEITRITWADLNTVKGVPMLWVRDRKDPKEKIGNDQNIPLLGDALKIIKRQPKKLLENGKHDERIFPFIADVVSRSFRQCALGAAVKGVHFHDTRHEGISRLFEQGYGIPEVCQVSGHKSWKSLQIYTNLDPADMHKGPLAKRAA